MLLQDEILLNKFGQDLISYQVLIDKFHSFELIERSKFLDELLFLILQSKPNDGDIGIAIKESRLKPTFTPCILLLKGVAYHNLKKIVELPEKEHEKVLKLLLSLFKVSYRKRFEQEKNDPDKWWYWDLSKEEVVRNIINNHSNL